MPAATAAFAGISLLALGAPFERRAPMLRLPWQSVSNLEALSLVVFMGWLAAICWQRTWPRWRTPLTRPWLVLLAVMAVSALAAPAARINALHMTGRLIFGFAVFLITVNGVTGSDRRRRLMAMTVLAGIVVSVLAILEYLQVGAVLRWLLAFREDVTVVGAQVRAGGPLQYATIASMYLEIVFALALGLLLAAFDTRRVIASAATFLGLLVIADAIILTFTRAGLVTIATSVALVVLARHARRGVDGGVRMLAVLSMLVVALFATSRSMDAVWLRLTSAGQDTWYRAAFDAPPTVTLTTGASGTIALSVENTGRLAWDSRASPPFYLSYHWLDADGDRIVTFEGVRTAFAEPVPPKTATAIRAQVRAPLQPGRYRLAWDIVQEGQLWFSTEPGATTIASLVTVSGPPLGQIVEAPNALVPRPAVRPGRLLLWRAAARMFLAHPLLGVGADNFRLLYGPYAGLTNADPRTHSNNLYLEVLVGGGLAGGAAFCWLLSCAMRCFAAGVRQASIGANEAAGIAAAGLAVLVHGTVDSFLSFTPTNILISIALGLSVASASDAGTLPDADRV